MFPLHVAEKVVSREEGRRKRMRMTRVERKGVGMFPLHVAEKVVSREEGRRKRMRMTRVERKGEDRWRGEKDHDLHTSRHPKKIQHVVRGKRGASYRICR
jgi:hypothetical protein